MMALGAAEVDSSSAAEALAAEGAAPPAPAAATMSAAIAANGEPASAVENGAPAGDAEGEAACESGGEAARSADAIADEATIAPVAPEAPAVEVSAVPPKPWLLNLAARNPVRSLPWGFTKRRDDQSKMLSDGPESEEMYEIES